MPDDFELNFNDGLQYFQMKQYPEAIQKFTDATNLKPGSSEAHYHLGRSFAENGDLDESIKELKETIQLNPKDADAYFELSRVYEAINQNGEAKDATTKAIELDPENDTYKAWIYHIFSKNKQFSNGISFFRGLIEKNPKNVRNHSILGLFYNENGMLEEALTEFKEQINLEPFEFKHYVSVAEQLREMGRIKEAEEFLLDALKSFPDNDTLKIHLGFTWVDKILQYCKEENWDQAVKEYKPFLDLDKNDDKGNIKNSGVTLYLKEKFKTKNQISDGINLFLRVFPTYPTNSELYSSLSEFLKLEKVNQEVIDDYLSFIRQGKDCAAIHIDLAYQLEIKNLKEVAVDEYRRGLCFEPDLAWPHCHIAEILMMNLNKPNEAFEEFSEGLTKDPDNPHLAIYHEYFALLLLGNRDRIDEALSHFHKSIMLKPTFTNTAYNEVLDLFRMGYETEAEQFFKKSIELYKEMDDKTPGVKGGLSESHCGLAKVYEETGRVENAIYEYRQAINLDPNDSDSYNSLGNLLLKTNNITDAIAEYRKAIQYGSKNPIYNLINTNIHKNLADALVKNSQILDAMNEYWEAMKLDPANDQYVDAYLTLKTSLKEKDEIERIISSKIKEISLSGGLNPPQDLDFQQLIAKGENEFVEFKTSALWSKNFSKEDIENSNERDIKKFGKDVSKIVIAKTIAGFLNTDGGNLVIGIQENKVGNKDEITGIEGEFSKLKDQCNDGYRRMIIDEIIRQYFPNEIFHHLTNYIKIEFLLCNGKTVCWLKVKRSEKPVYLKIQNDDNYFFIRVDATTRQIAGKVATEYCLTRIKEK